MIWRKWWIHPILKIDLMQFILYFKSSWLQNSLEGIESILPLPPQDLCFLFYGWATLCHVRSHQCPLSFSNCCCFHICISPLSSSKLSFFSADQQCPLSFSFSSYFQQVFPPSVKFFFFSGDQQCPLSFSSWWADKCDAENVFFPSIFLFFSACSLMLKLPPS